MRRWTIVLAAVVCAAPAVQAREDLSTSEMQKLSAQPGVDVARRTDGGATVTTWTKNGVMIERRTEGAKATVLENDASGRGAVVCTWMIDASIRADLEACPSTRFAELKEDLDASLAAIDAFIVANSVAGVSMDDMRAREATQYAKVHAMVRTTPGEASKLCTEGDTGLMISFMNRMSRDQRRKAVDDLLSVSRWPVSNPCL